MDDTFKRLDGEIEIFLKRIDEYLEDDFYKDKSLTRQLKRLLSKTRTTVYYLRKTLEKKLARKVLLEMQDKSIIDLIRELESITRLYNNNLLAGNEGDFKSYHKKLLNYKSTFDKYLQNEKSNDDELKYLVGHESFVAGDKVTMYVSHIEDAYRQSSELMVKLDKDHKLLTTRLSKLSEQQTRVDQLEDKYREAILQFSVDEEEYREKLALIDKVSSVASDFIPKINEVNDRLKNIDDETNASIGNFRSLNSFASRNSSIYERNHSELESLISKVKSVLGDANSAAVGEHFKNQYDMSKRYILSWPFFGALFLLGAIFICILTVFPEVYIKIFGGNVKFTEMKDANIPYIISRVLVAPLFLIGAWFCANQYIKQKSIIEDYAHKKVLSLSLLSIKTEIEKTGVENTSEFIKAMQKEILKSPLDSLDKKHYGKEAKLLNQVRGQIFSNLTSQLSKQVKSNKKAGE